MPRKGSQTLSGGYSEAHRLFPLAGVLCQQCAAAPATDRHHVDHNPRNNTGANIRLLCEPCHFALHPHMRDVVRMRAIGRRGQPRAIAAAAVARRGRTHCKHGHEFTPENTYVIPGSPGWRQCRTCKGQSEKARRHRASQSAP